MSTVAAEHPTQAAEPSREKLNRVRFQAFKAMCVATTDYYWEYQPRPILIKHKGKPLPLMDEVIYKHAFQTLHPVCLGLSPFVDNLFVRFGSIDVDVHPPAQGAIQAKRAQLIAQFGEDGVDARVEEWLDETLDCARQRLKEDLPKLTQALDALGYLYFLNSSGSEGIHLRVYSNTPILAKTMRLFLLDLQERVLGEVRHEVFPKQVELTAETPYGNQLKAPLAIHPKTNKLAGIIVGGEILDRAGSLDFLVEFAKNIPNAKPIVFDAPPQLIKRHIKPKLTAEERALLPKADVPGYCPGIEEVACVRPLPSGKATRHDFLDGNMYQYFNGEGEGLRAYMEIQGRDWTAFNRCGEWRWSCKTIRKYLEANKGDAGVSQWTKLCKKCPHFSRDVVPDMLPIIEAPDETTRNRLVKDFLKSKLQGDAIDIESTINNICEVTTFTKKALADFIDGERKKETKKSAKDKVQSEEQEIKLLQILACYSGWETEEGQTPRRREIDVKLGNELLAKFLLRQNALLYDPWNDELKIYGSRNFYEKCGEHVLKSIIQTILGKHNNRNVQAEVLNKLKNLAPATTFIPTHPSNLLPFQNGVLDINTGELLPHSPDQFWQYQVPINYNPEAKCPLIDAFISQVVEQQKRSLIHDCFGLILFRGNLLEKIFVFVGGGQNGKTILIKLLEAAAGEENCSSVPLHQLVNDRFALAATWLKLLNCGADIGGKIIYDASMLRTLSSKDSVAAQFKFGQIFNFVPTATLVFSANTPPIFAEDNLGMFRRLETITFPVNFGNEADLEKHPDWQAADPLLLQKLTTQEELEGFVARGVTHLVNILKTSALSVMRSTDELREEYIMRSDSLRAFLETNCVEEIYVPTDREAGNQELIPAFNFIPKFEFYDRYKKWCTAKKLPCFSSQRVGRAIREYGWGITFGKDQAGGSREESYRGVRWR